jgi:hypothetical protein
MHHRSSACRFGLKLREVHRPRVFESRVLRKIFEPKGDDVSGKLRRPYIIMKSFMIRTVHHIVFVR